MRLTRVMKDAFWRSSIPDESFFFAIAFSILVSANLESILKSSQNGDRREEEGGREGETDFLILRRSAAVSIFRPGEVQMQIKIAKQNPRYPASRSAPARIRLKAGLLQHNNSRQSELAKIKGSDLIVLTT
jgi:hypothetical protein